MPTYQFMCLACNEQFEEKRPFAKASDLATCPNCESDQTKKLLSVVAVKMSQPSIPVSMTNGGGCCGGGSCGCHH